MSRRYTANGKRISSMQHAKHAHFCSCGRVVHGNGGKTSHRAMHERAGDGHRRVTRSMFDALFPGWGELPIPERFARKVPVPQEVADTPEPALVIGQIWQRADGSLVRVRRFSTTKINGGWVGVRELGGNREKDSYPPATFTDGTFVFVSEPPPARVKLAASIDERLPLRFREKVEVQSNGCWFWMGATYERGYGCIRVDGRSQSTHVFAYEALAGPVPDGLELDHVCCMPPCCNPAHLEPVTHTENMRRAWLARRGCYRRLRDAA